MKKHLLYAKYVFRHKWFVFREGLKLGVPLRQLLIHDWSKCMPSEWTPYVLTFYGTDGEKICAADRFEHAWLLHQKRNPHHHQWWLLPQDDGDMKALPMPDRYRREMIADWIGAGLAQGKPDTAAWYEKNKAKMRLHPDTRKWVENRLRGQP